jgi:IS30 family transposase
MLTFENGKEFEVFAHIDEHLQSIDSFASSFSYWDRDNNKTFNSLLL